MSGRQQRVMVQPIVSILKIYFEPYSISFQNVIFKNLQQVQSFRVFYSLISPSYQPFQKSKVVVWLYDNIEMRIEGQIIVSRLFCRPSFLRGWDHALIYLV